MINQSNARIALIIFLFYTPREYREERKRSIDNLSKWIFYYKYQARDVNDNNNWYSSYINVFIVNGALVIKKTHRENGREQVNDINISCKKKTEKGKKSRRYYNFIAIS